MATDPAKFRLLGEWTAPSGAQVTVTAHLRLELQVSPPELQPDDKRWFLEDVLPQLRAPVQAMIEAQLNVGASAVTWLAPDDEAPA
jgi:hypothetical protein